MSALGVAADQHTYVILLQACAQEGHAQLAERVWWELRGMGAALVTGCSVLELERSLCRVTASLCWLCRADCVVGPVRWGRWWSLAWV